MTDKEIMELLTRDVDIWEKGKLFRAAFDAQKPGALNIQPIKQRKARQPKPRATSPLTKAVNGIMSEPEEQPDNAH